MNPKLLVIAMYIVQATHAVCEKDSELALLEGQVEIVDVARIRGENYLILRVCNTEHPQVSISLSKLGDELANFVVVDHNANKTWGTFGSMPSDSARDGVVITLKKNKSHRIWLDLPPSELFAETTFSTKIQFQHWLLKKPSPIFEVSRTSGSMPIFKLTQRLATRTPIRGQPPSQDSSSGKGK